MLINLRRFGCGMNGKKWGRDKGVDLIAKYKGRNKFCAIQAKCYAAHNQVSYEDGKFLADSNRVEIEDRILMMSTDRLVKIHPEKQLKAKKTCCYP